MKNLLLTIRDQERIASIPLNQGQSITIGSSASADFSFPVVGLESVHLKLFNTPNGCFLECVSANAVALVNDVPQNRRRLRVGDKVTIGTLSLEIEQTTKEPQTNTPENRLPAGLKIGNDLHRPSPIVEMANPLELNLDGGLASAETRSESIVSPDHIKPADGTSMSESDSADFWERLLGANDSTSATSATAATLDSEQAIEPPWETNLIESTFPIESSMPNDMFPGTGLTAKIELTVASQLPFEVEQTNSNAKDTSSRIHAIRDDLCRVTLDLGDLPTLFANTQLGNSFRIDPQTLQLTAVDCDGLLEMLASGWAGVIFFIEPNAPQLSNFAVKWAPRSRFPAALENTLLLASPSIYRGLFQTTRLTLLVYSANDLRALMLNSERAIFEKSE